MEGRWSRKKKSFCPFPSFDFARRTRRQNRLSPKVSGLTVYGQLKGFSPRAHPSLCVRPYVFVAHKR